MILSEKEPYEENIQTRAKWLTESESIKCRFKRSSKTETIIWSEYSEVFADKLFLFNKENTWKGEIQAMTEVKFHLHVESLKEKNLLLYSGSIEKKTGFNILLNRILF